MYTFRSVRTLSTASLQAMKVGRIHQRRIVSLALPAMQSVLAKKIMKQDILAVHVNKFDLSGSCGILSSSCQFSTASETVSEDSSEVSQEMDDSIGKEHRWPSPVSTQHFSNISRNDKSIFVGGYNFNHDESNLKDLFSQFGEIDSVFVPLKDVYLNNSPNEDSYRFAFVYFTENQSAQNALQQKSIKLQSGETVEIKERQKSKKALENEKTFVVYNLPDSVTPDNIIEKFAVFGDIELANFVFNAASHDPEKSKNYAFLVFKNIPADIPEILNSSLTLDSSELVVKQMARQARPQPRNRCLKILVENLPQNFVTEEILRSHFGTYGTVEYVKIISDPDPEDHIGVESKTSSAIIQYNSYEEALNASREAIQGVDGASVTVRSLGWKEL